MNAERWNKLSVSEQILNIGGEVQRAVDRKMSQKDDVARRYLDKALEWLALSKADPKNERRIPELDLLEEELIDYFSDNVYGNDCNSIMTYYDSFNSAVF